MVLPAPRQQTELVPVNAEALNALLPYVSLFRGFVTDLVLISCLFGEYLLPIRSESLYSHAANLFIQESSRCLRRPRRMSSCTFVTLATPVFRSEASPRTSRKGLHLRSARILLAATVMLFTSTTVFFAYELALVAISADIASDVARGLAAAPTSPPDMDERELNRGMYYQAVQVCVSASTVTVNVSSSVTRRGECSVLGVPD